MKAYSLDLRERIIQAVQEGCTPEEAAALFAVSSATVRRYLRRLRLGGSLRPKPRPGRPRTIAEPEAEELRAQVAAAPTATLAEHCRQWQTRGQRRVSVATMCRALAHLGLTRKKGRSMPKNKTRPSGWRGGNR